MENEKPIWVDDISRLEYQEVTEVKSEERKSGVGIWLQRVSDIEHDKFFVSFYSLHRDFTLLSELPENELPENEGGH